MAGVTTQAALLIAKPGNVDKVAKFIFDKLGIEYLQIFINNILNRLSSQYGASDMDMELAARLADVKIEGAEDVCDISMEIKRVTNEILGSYKG